MNQNYPTLVVKMPENPKQQRERIAAAIANEVRLLEAQGASKTYLGLQLMKWLIEARAENEKLLTKLNAESKTKSN